MAVQAALRTGVGLCCLASDPDTCRLLISQAPEAIIQPTESNLDLTLAVMNLPKKYRETIMLYYYQDMDVREIGTVLGIAQSSVSNRLKKGRDMLRKALEGRI